MPVRLPLEMRLQIGPWQELDDSREPAGRACFGAVDISHLRPPCGSVAPGHPMAICASAPKYG